MIQEELENGLSKNKIKEKLGPAVAGVYDPATGKYYFGINNLEGDIPQNLHKLLLDKYVSMPENGIYSEYNKYTLGAGSHAEIYALNKALTARGEAGITTNSLNELMLTVIKGPKSGWKNIRIPMPRCPHCEYITDGVYFYPEVLKYGK